MPMNLTDKLAFGKKKSLANQAVNVLQGEGLVVTVVSFLVLLNSLPNEIKLPSNLLS